MFCLGSSTAEIQKYIFIDYFVYIMIKVPEINQLFYSQFLVSVTHKWIHIVLDHCVGLIPEFKLLRHGHIADLKSEVQREGLIINFFRKNKINKTIISCEMIVCGWWNFAYPFRDY